MNLYKKHFGTYPPKNSPTRWGSFIETSLYIKNNINSIFTFMKENINTNNSSKKKISNFLLLFEDNETILHLTRVCEFEFLVQGIKYLQSEGIERSQQIGIYDEIGKKLHSFSNLSIENQEIYQQFICSKQKNPDLEFINNPINIFNRIDEQLVLLFRYAPLTTVEVERSFSVRNATITNRRLALSDNSMLMLNICRWARKKI